MYKIVIKTKNNKQSIISIDYANTFIKRLKGLMFKDKITPLLYKQYYENRLLATIHTLFMKKTIAIIYVNTDDEIQEIITLKPWQIYIPQKSGIKYIIEVSENTIKENNIEITNKIKVLKKETKKEIE
ncbi:DUF192 domain-containing protein [Methanosphaera sp. WGK6]|uniref:DUF192 domain-containing protein n=1 Tax=Methanosphaera sp. WGK6 TaxID=1561964 RepID=UPI00084C62C5|nr:DUF192 domain-containing protein [Methanosphaera sp. WGK6]OED30004.1 hypothetical protein NL43_05515 [Methanosphaera sp. WGK6]